MYTNVYKYMNYKSGYKVQSGTFHCFASRLLCIKHDKKERIPSSIVMWSH